MRPQKPRLIAALSAYLLLAVLAAFTLTGVFRVVVWLSLAAFAVKTWIAALRED